jgi:hypothetical protein
LSILAILICAAITNKALATTSSVIASPFRQDRRSPSWPIRRTGNLSSQCAGSRRPSCSSAAICRADEFNDDSRLISDSRFPEIFGLGRATRDEAEAGRLLDELLGDKAVAVSSRFCVSRKSHHAVNRLQWLQHNISNG